MLVDARLMLSAPECVPTEPFLDYDPVLFGADVPMAPEEAMAGEEEQALARTVDARLG